MRIKELAEQQGLNITTLSRKAELSYTSVHLLWHQKMSMVAMTTLERVALALGVRVNELFGGEPGPEGETEHLVPNAAPTGITER